MPIQKNANLLPYAKNFAKTCPPHERKLWYLFLRSYPVKINKQRIIDTYIVDFYCASSKLVIGIDGTQHYENNGLTQDARRHKALEQMGLRILHFRNRDTDRDFEGVCRKINYEIRGAGE